VLDFPTPEHQPADQISRSIFLRVSPFPVFDFVRPVVLPPISVCGSPASEFSRRALAEPGLFPVELSVASLFSSQSFSRAKHPAARTRLGFGFSVSSFLRSTVGFAGVPARSSVLRARSTELATKSSLPASVFGFAARDFLLATDAAAHFFFIFVDLGFVRCEQGSQFVEMRRNRPVRIL
jgi:hypothetical protein